MLFQPIIETKHKLDGSVSHYDCHLLAFSEKEAIVCYRLQKPAHLMGVFIPEGTLSVGYFWPARPYNIYQFVSAHKRDTTLGFYINICDQTRVSQQAISWRDLVIDWLLLPGGRSRLLDVQELPQSLDPLLSTYIWQASWEVWHQRFELQHQCKQQTKQLLRYIA